MILTISDSEEGILNKIKSVLACESTLEVMEITNSEKLTFQGLEIDQLQRSVIKDGKVVELTRHEYDLLFYLVKNKNIALSRDKLLEEVWGYDFFGDDRTVDTHIKMLRNSLGEYRKFIVTLRGMGYKFEAV